mmetsp:Transcript_53878/g.149840  ORF Transcript_53878/g.149840 Transcript_53878/m.149840 type:complete len:215 (+) Transcript_53878:1036-1680(+)
MGRREPFLPCAPPWARVAHQHSGKHHPRDCPGNCYWRSEQQCAAATYGRSNGTLWGTGPFGAQQRPSGHDGTATRLCARASGLGVVRDSTTRPVRFHRCAVERGGFATTCSASAFGPGRLSKYTIRFIGRKWGQRGAACGARSGGRRTGFVRGALGRSARRAGCSGGNSDGRYCKFVGVFSSYTGRGGRGGGGGRDSRVVRRCPRRVRNRIVAG